MPSDLELAVRWSKRFEAHLARRYGATGRGLHEKLDSIEAELDRGALRDLRYLATVRNKLVHEEGYDRLDDRRTFRTRVGRAARAVGLRTGLPRAFVAAAAAGFVGAVIAAFLLTR